MMQIASFQAAYSPLRSGCIVAVKREDLKAARSFLDKGLDVAELVIEILCPVLSWCRFLRYPKYGRGVWM